MTDSVEKNSATDLIQTVEVCIGLLATWFSEGRTSVEKSEAIEYLKVNEAEYESVMGTLESRGIIKQKTALEASPFHEFTIEPKVADSWKEIQSRDIVDEIKKVVRSSRATAWIIIIFLGLTALLTGGNQGYTFLKNLGVVSEQASPTPTPSPTPSPIASPDGKAVPKYQGQPLSYWEEKLYDKDAAEAAKGSNALLKFGKLAVPALITALSSDDDETVKVAAITLGGIGPAAIDAIPDLERAKQKRKSLQPQIEKAISSIRTR